MYSDTFEYKIIKLSNLIFPDISGDDEGQKFSKFSIMIKKNRQNQKQATKQFIPEETFSKKRNQDQKYYLLRFFLLFFHFFLGLLSFYRQSSCSSVSSFSFIAVFLIFLYFNTFAWGVRFKIGESWAQSQSSTIQKFCKGPKKNLKNCVLWYFFLDLMP